MSSWPRVPHAWWFVASAIFVALSGQTELRSILPLGQPPRQLEELDVARIGELHRITDTLGERIWPGFDTRKIPVAVNNQDRQEMLIGHPNPPPEFHPFEAFQLGGQPVMIREGATRYGPRGGGWAVELGGVQSAYVGTLGPHQATDTYLALLIHECFHCYQIEYRARADDVHGQLPEDDPVYAALIGLEGLTLKAALDASDPAEVRQLAGMFVAVRAERRKNMAPNLITLEGEEEYNEGTATYSAARMYQLLAEQGGMPDSDRLQDPHYSGFQGAKEEYASMISAVVPPVAEPITFFHAMYQHGMAQCLLLDRLRPEWKAEMRAKGMTQFALLEKETALDDAARQTLLAAAKGRFDFDALLASQRKLVDDRLNLIRSYIAADGRRYRVYHNNLKGRFNWKPMGPVYHVPESLERELAARSGSVPSRQEGPGPLRTLWVGGIRRFEKGEHVFESVDTPVLFGADYLEWVDTTPAPDASDLRIESASHEGDVHTEARIRCDGFSIQSPQVRIEWSADVVNIYLM